MGRRGTVLMYRAPGDADCVVPLLVPPALQRYLMNWLLCLQHRMFPRTVCITLWQHVIQRLWGSYWQGRMTSPSCGAGRRLRRPYRALQVSQCAVFGASTGWLCLCERVRSCWFVKMTSLSFGAAEGGENPTGLCRCVLCGALSLTQTNLSGRRQGWYWKFSGGGDIKKDGLVCTWRLCNAVDHGRGGGRALMQNAVEGFCSPCAGGLTAVSLICCCCCCRQWSVHEQHL